MATASKPSSQEDPSPPDVYTVFSVRHKRIIIAVLGIAMLTSPLTATMYFPLLPLLSTNFKVSPQAINLTITLYIIFQALAPLLLASVSDHFGRRPIYLASFFLYTFASLGLALNRSSYAALLVLRALQSLGASAILSVSYGTIADISVPAERGKVQGPLLAAGNVGTCVGPIVGGWIALGSGSFHWAFWALVIFGGFVLFAVALMIPETARNVVGNGSVEDRPWNQPIWVLFQHCQRRRKGMVERPESKYSDMPRTSPTRKIQFIGPLSSLRIIFYADTSLIIWLCSSYYALWYCIQASIPFIYESTAYNFDRLQVGLAYLPGSIGVILSMYLSGKAIDYNYRYVAESNGLPVDKVRGDDLTNFPIERARSRGCAYLLLVSFGVMVGYGWSIEKHVHVAFPLICQFFQGFLATWIIQCYSALLVDGYPEAPSTAATAGNVMRCALSAAAVAVLAPILQIMGHGWFFSLLGLLGGLGGLAAQTTLRRQGMKWRNARRGRTRNQIVEQSVEQTSTPKSNLNFVMREKVSTGNRTRGCN